MNTTHNTTRSLKTKLLTSATSLVLALSASAPALAQSAEQTNPAQANPAQATATQNAVLQTPSVIHNVESFISAAELLQHEVQFTPASIDINALKRSVIYPEAALKRNVSGKFELIVYVNSNGNVNSVNFVSDRTDDSGMNAIIASACEAVKKSTFTPATLNHKSISSAVRIPFNFVL